LISKIEYQLANLLSKQMSK